MRDRGITSRVPDRWRLAGEVLRRVPDMRGRDRLVGTIAGPNTPARYEASPTRLDLGLGFTLTACLADDGSFRSAFFGQYSRPALLPILQAFLPPGGAFCDIGANIGIYSLVASNLVGHSGIVDAFEPVPTTRAWLEQFCLENEAANVRVHPLAVSNRAAKVLIEARPSASGLSHIVAAGAALADPASTSFVVESVRLDEVLGDANRLDLVKIDVEGFEADVIEGMTGIVSKVRPAVVFESPDSLAGHIGDTARAVEALAGAGYRVFGLTPRGLSVEAIGSAHNLLAVDVSVHGAMLARLKDVRFARNQNL